MQNDMRDRLIELIQNAVGGCARHWAKIIADHLLANGVIVPPCKVGDKIYTYGAKRVKEWKITFCGENSRGEFLFKAVDEGFKNLLDFWNYEIGKTVFLTKEEAECALAERVGRND